MKTRRLLLLLGGVAVLTLAGILIFRACRPTLSAPRPVAEVPELSLPIARFDRDFLTLSDTLLITSRYDSLRRTYGVFADDYVAEMMGFGDPDSLLTLRRIYAYLTDPFFGKSYHEAVDHFPSADAVSAETSRAFGVYLSHIPDDADSIPQLAFHVSGFQMPLMYSGDYLSASIDLYLGADYPTYKNLGTVASYRLPQMSPDKIPLDFLHGYLTSRYAPPSSMQLLDRMLYEGKLRYVMAVCFPGRTEADVMNYTDAQLSWCLSNQRQMWSYMMDEKHLFSTDRMTVVKYIDPSPSTSFFPQDSPGQTGIWLGLQIVKSYMRAHPSTSLAALMAMDDSRLLLQQSQYSPR